MQAPSPRITVEALQNVQGTSDDAAVSKLSACQRGYYEDDFIHIFVGKEAKRSPIINRGYYARVAAMDMVIDRFMQGTDGRGQIVALGAGSDTTFFRLSKAGTLPDKYVELDLRGVVLKKLSVLLTHDEVREHAAVSREAVLATAQELETAVLQSDKYALACVDLREVDDFQRTLERVEGFDFAKPTLFISECVLCYVEPEESGRLLRWIRDKFAAPAFVEYTQILPNDPFGATMLGHFRTRGCPLLSIQAFPDLDAQRKRFADLGWSEAEVYDMNDIYYKCIDKEDLKRAEKLEIFDEFEEWHMMQGHYCIVLAKHDTTAGKLLSKVKLLLDSAEAAK